MKILAYALLLVGLCVASAAGARNGEQHVEYRQALWAANEAGSENTVTLPPPLQRLAQWWDVGGVGWVLGLGLITGGALLARRIEHQENSGQGQEGEDDSVDFLVNIQQVRTRLDKLAEDIAELPMDADVPALREEIDQINDTLLHPLVEARGRFVARHGIGVFAGYFGAFSGGERNLARTWSALTDGHAAEARASLERARAGFAEAEAEWIKADEALTSKS